jgi:hypothetical protein
MRDLTNFDTEMLERMSNMFTSDEPEFKRIHEELQKRNGETSTTRKQFTCTVTKAPVGMDERVLRFIGSTPAEDRDGDTIDVAGWELAHFNDNPVFLWAHRYDIPPLGKAVNVMKDTTNGTLVFDIKFASIEELGDSEHAKFAESIYRMYKHGYMSATSVGFIGKEYTYKTDENGKPTWGKHFTSQELMELSAVPVPSNPTALIQARGMFGDEVVAKCFGDVEQKAYTLRFDSNAKRIDLVAESGEVAEFVASPLIKSNLFYLSDILGAEDIEKALLQKAGATLNRKNRADLQQASDLILGVLASSMTEETQTGDKTADAENVTHAKSTNGNDAHVEDEELVIVDDMAEQELLIIED